MKLSKMVKSYMAKLTFRTTTFIVVLLIYFFNKDYLQFQIGKNNKGYLIIVAFCIIMFVEMLIQINPKSNITKGCLKQFKSHYKPFNKKVDQKEIDNFVKDSDIAAVKIVVVWTLFNLIFGYLYKKEIIRDAEMIVLTSFYYLADLLCVMFFCPFQKYIMKNRCCITCRIFAWGLPMMTFPLHFNVPLICPSKRKFVSEVMSPVIFVPAAIILYCELCVSFSFDINLLFMLNFH